MEGGDGRGGTDGVARTGTEGGGTVGATEEATSGDTGGTTRHATALATATGGGLFIVRSGGLNSAAGTDLSHSLPWRWYVDPHLIAANVTDEAPPVLDTIQRANSSR